MKLKSKSGGYLVLQVGIEGWSHPRPRALDSVLGWLACDAYTRRKIIAVLWKEGKKGK